MTATWSSGWGGVSSVGGGNANYNTGSAYAPSGGSGSSSWWKKYKNSSNPWESALTKAYDDASNANGEGKYTSEWDSAVASAKELTGKDYGDELNALAQEEIDKEKAAYGSELGKIGMRELQFRKDIQDDWAARRTKASTQAEIDAQQMQTDALSALTSTIEGASSYELEQIAADLEQASTEASIAKSGAETNSDWEKMVSEILSKYEG